MTTRPSFNFAKRWQHGAERWVAPRDLFSPSGYAVDVLAGRDEARARQFVTTHHYAGTYPASRLAVGLFGACAQLVGVAVFSVPCTARVLAKHTRGLADLVTGAELGRFVCAPSVGYNGETWFLSRAFKLVRAEKPIRAVVSFADPLERHTAAGILSKRAHWGTIYQASNALYVGRSSARTLTLTPRGAVLSPRALSKIHTEDRGWRYAAEQLLAAGAPPREPHESLAEWVTRALRAPGFRHVRHPGNLAYVFGLDASMRSELRAAHAGGLSYPKRRAA